MLTKISKNHKRGHVHDRIRKKMQGTAERPRLNVYRSLNHIYVQVVDDLHGKTLVSASTAEGKKEDRRTGGNVAAAKAIGKVIAERAKAKGVTKVVFTVGSRLWPMPRVKRDCSSKGSSQLSALSYQLERQAKS